MRRVIAIVLALATAALLLVATGRLLRTPKPATATFASDNTVSDTSADSDPTPDGRPTDALPLPDVLVDPAVVVDKSSRRLTVLSDGEPVKGYRIALGSDPVGTKSREGDGRTPEGSYYVCSKNPESRYHRSLGLSYPNIEDAEKGRADGVISASELRSITTAIRRMQRPPWKTGLGGEIMIHGSGSGRGDWTLGCIALDDEDIDELFVALPLGTPVEIRP